MTTRHHGGHGGHGGIHATRGGRNFSERESGSNDAPSMIHRWSRAEPVQYSAIGVTTARCETILRCSRRLRCVL
jgi:hypothetical protein